MDATVVLLPGDGIGPEVIAVAQDVLQAVGRRFGHMFRLAEYPIGGVAIEEHATALPNRTLRACLESDAVLLGAVGGPRWDDPAARIRPEQGLLGLRKAMALYANLRPVRTIPALADASPLRPERLQDVDLLIVRELTGGLYFGQPRLRRRVDGEVQAVDTMTYTEGEIQRVARMAFELAHGRRRKVTSVDKANVLECSRLWRQTVSSVSAEFPDVSVEHLLVDAAAMHLINRPGSFDVILTENLFGDILSDEASVLAGSMGVLPSAALGTTTNNLGLPRGLYEPVHGSAPDIAGKGIANPIGAILSVAMALRHSLGLDEEARTVEKAVEQALLGGARTADLVKAGESALPTARFGDIIIADIQDV